VRTRLLEIDGPCCKLLKNGAQGRNRTTDTAIFSRMLYQLSYLGPPVATQRTTTEGG
jgi:hypothetical protein